MNWTRKAIWLAALAIAIVLGHRAAPAGEVTVIDSVRDGKMMSGDGPVEFLPEAPPPSPALVYSAKPEAPNLVFPSRPFNTAWYTKLEYLHWDEQRWDENQSIESGLLYTLGYARRFGSERIRGELFAGNMQYSGYVTGEDGYSLERAFATIGYFGGRGEYEYLWDLDVDGWLPVTLFAGIGARLWNKSAFDLRTESGERMASCTQAWWTIYPYLGAERRWDLNDRTQFFASGRIGCTVLTFNHLSIASSPAYYPNPGITGQLECGLRRGHLFLAGYFEAMSFQRSEAEHLHGGGVNDWYCWPNSQMFTSGLKAGITY